MKIGVDVSNDELKKAISELRIGSKDDNTTGRILRNLVSGSYIIPVTMEPKPAVNENGEISAEGKYKINIRIITNNKKESFIPCYTDYEEYDKGLESKNTQDADKLVMTYDEIIPMIKQSGGRISGLVVNPFGESMPFNTELIDRLENDRKKGPLSKKEVKPGAGIKLRTPKYMPIDMLEEAKKLLAEEPDVSAAYMQMMETEDGEDQYLIVIEGGDDMQGIFAKLGPELKEYSFGIKVVFTPSDNPLGQKVLELTEPFYTK